MLRSLCAFVISRCDLDGTFVTFPAQIWGEMNKQGTRVDISFRSRAGTDAVRA